MPLVPYDRWGDILPFFYLILNTLIGLNDVPGNERIINSIFIYSVLDWFLC